MQSVRELESKHIVQTYNRTPIVLVRGKGVCVFDAEGREYIDLLAGIGVGALGHGHEGLANAIAEQAREMIHCSNLFFHPLQGQVAERLAKLSGLSRAFFCNSGAEAVEACLKFARRYW
ncbi:MAG TPA: aminotransferase class III-fold pyridoxal phosphate-dependent enzyme, partial [Vicinamibacterales bacterium]|nr:aminotransferase class III-fold pyridoxal phosphate-dependent enzyme [Vicinamibacterales bacterium]